MTTPSIASADTAIAAPCDIAALDPWIADALAVSSPMRLFAAARELTGLRFGSNAAIALALISTATPKRGPRGLSTLCKKQATSTEVADSAVHALVLAMHARRHHLTRSSGTDVPLGEVAAAAAQHFAVYPAAAALCFELAGQFLLEPSRSEAHITPIAPTTALAVTAAWVHALAAERGCETSRVLVHLQRLAATPGGTQ